jgi:hypothetical protein
VLARALIAVLIGVGLSVIGAQPSAAALCGSIRRAWEPGNQGEAETVPTKEQLIGMQKVKQSICNK